MNPAETLVRFDGLDCALVDASSIIYMNKAGFLKSLAAAIALYTLPEIKEETGYRGIPITLVEAPTSHGTNDEKLIECALERRWPLISEDRKILTRMRKEEIPFFNALMMLHFLLYRGKIEAGSHERCLAQLLKTAWYGKDVLDYGDRLLRLVISRGIRGGGRRSSGRGPSSPAR